MFSIEKILDEVIVFIKKIFNTFYISLFKLVDYKLFKDKLIKSNIYLLICILLFLDFKQLNFSVFDDTFKTYLQDYYSFLERPLSTIIIYTLPLGFFIFIIIQTLGKKLFKDNSDYMNFKNLSFYSTGTALIISLLIEIIYVAIIFSQQDPLGGFPIYTKNITLILMLIENSSLPICFLFPLISLIKNRQKINNYKFFVIPFLTLSSIFLCSYFLDFFLPHTELAPKNAVKFTNSLGKNQFYIEDSCLKDCDFTEIKSSLIMHNIGSSSIFVRKEDKIWFEAYSDNEDIKGGALIQFDLHIKAMDYDTDSELKILKPGEYLVLSCENIVETKSLKKLLSVTNKMYSSDDFQVKMNYITISDVKPRLSVFSELAAITVDTIN